MIMLFVFVPYTIWKISFREHFISLKRVNGRKVKTSSWVSNVVVVVVVVVVVSNRVLISLMLFCFISIRSCAI